MENRRGLEKAKSAKNDEFYTLYEDVEEEVGRYVNYDKDIFKDKVILLPCDDPEWSNFVKYFFDNFNNFGLKKLIASSFEVDGQGSYFIFDRYNIDSLKWGDFKALKLKGDGDYASKEVTAFRDEADFVITNPPFSKIKHFFAWLKEKEGLKFSIIAPLTCVDYVGIFPSIKNKECWFGGGEKKKTTMTFKIPDSDLNKETGELGGFYSLGVVLWLTNIKDGIVLKDLELNTMAHNLEHNKKLLKRPDTYKKYDNYNAIEVPYVDAIPIDYDGLVGVPITFLLKNNYRQFEIVTLASGNSRVNKKETLKEAGYEFNRLDRGGMCVIGETLKFSRLIIRPIKN